MFTGIIEEIGQLKSIHKQGQGMVMEIHCQKVLEGTKLGDSISTDGVCLTVSSLGDKGFSADVMPETVKRTGFAHLAPGSPLNLERAMAANGRFGGHMVSGHIDGTGDIQAITPTSNAVLVTICTTAKVLRYVIEKGSIAIDGISLTVVDVAEESFRVSLIPTTAKDTTLLGKKVGDKVNLECDIVGKYIERFAAKKESPSSISMSMLADNGFL